MPAPRTAPCPLRLRPVVPFVAEDAFGVALGVVVLAVAQRPEKGQQPQRPQQQRYRDQEGQHLHQRNLSAFSVTQIELADIASAAIRGVAKPAMAIGTARML